MSLFRTVAAAGLATAVMLSFAGSAFAMRIIIVPPPVTKPSPTPQPTSHGVTSLDCTARGYDLTITNFGGDNADSGRQVTWAATNGTAGELSLPKMLAPGESVHFTDALDEFAARGTDCQAGFA